jgi:asparagine synthase (glutamine-hydrolysing)
VLLAALTQWGIEAALPRFNGMFAFAVWDRQTPRLHLVRDRLGEKPLYYGWMGKAFLFASELKGLRAHPQFKEEINRNSLALYLRHDYIPSPYSIYQGISKLLPGTMATLAPDGTGWTLTVAPYWSAREAAERGLREPFTGTPQEAVLELDGLLADSVRLRLESDVPLGAFLSGGLDSSTVVALMQRQGQGQVRTFTIGFWEPDFDEAPHARMVAKHLETAHTQLYVTPEQALAVIPRLPTLYDEPFSDSSQIPTFLISELARRAVTVCLSGDGGDELFAGYNRYFIGRALWRKIGWAPVPLRQATARGLRVLPTSAWARLFDNLAPVLPASFSTSNPADKLQKLAEILAVDSPDRMYVELVSHWKAPASVVIGSSEPATILTDRARWARLPDFTQRMMYLDAVTYLPDDILVKVDRASMGVSLEVRVPFLDHRVFEFAWRLPLAMKIQHDEGKWLLRKLLARYVPRALTERPKMGFGVPIDQWLRGPLREWAESLLDESRLRREGFFHPDPIRRMWGEHLSGLRNWQHHLWTVLMFQAWREKWG